MRETYNAYDEYTGEPVVVVVDPAASQGAWRDSEGQARWHDDNLSYGSDQWPHASQGWTGSYQNEATIPGYVVDAQPDRSRSAGVAPNRVAKKVLAALLTLACTGGAFVGGKQLGREAFMTASCFVNGVPVAGNILRFGLPSLDAMCQWRAQENLKQIYGASTEGDQS